MLALAQVRPGLTAHCGELHTRLQPSTSICVSSGVHFLRGFFSGRGAAGSWGSDLRVLPFLASVSCCCSTLLGPAEPVSSRKSQNMGGDDGGMARETLRCLGGATIAGSNEHAACVPSEKNRSST